MDHDPDMVEQFVKALEPEFTFADRICTTSFHEALDSILQQKTHLCFISDSLSREKATTLIQDARKVEQTKNVIFILVKPVIQSDQERVVKDFAAAITSVANSADRIALAKCLDPIAPKLKREEELRQSTLALNVAIKHLMKQVDDLAKDKKRGVKGSFDALFQHYVEDITALDQESLEKYYELLCQKASELKPQGFEKIEVPDAILKRKLPKLTKDNYEGASRRVWGKLSNKFKKPL